MADKLSMLRKMKRSGYPEQKKRADRMTAEQIDELEELESELADATDTKERASPLSAKARLKKEKELKKKEKQYSK